LQDLTLKLTLKPGHSRSLRPFHLGQSDRRRGAGGRVRYPVYRRPARWAGDRGRANR